jgi:hypothetical protein
MANGITSFPNPISSDDDKASAKYGMQFIKAVYSQWINSGLNGQSRQALRVKFDYNRSFAMGSQPMQEYLDILDVSGEISVVNLAYDPLPIAIPFLNRVKDRMMERSEKIVCNAIDPFSQDKKKFARDNAVFKMQEAPRIAALQEASGVNIEDFKEDDPQDEGEVDIEWGFNYKEKEEVIMENGIELVFYENDFDNVIKDRIIDEISNCGYAPCNVDIDNNGRIKIRPIRPENFFCSSSEWNDYRDAAWMGEAYNMNIKDIRQAYPGKVSEEKLFALAKKNTGNFGNPANMNYGWDYAWTNAPNRPYDNFNVEVIKVVLKTIDNIKYEVSDDKFGKKVLDRKKVEMPGKDYIKSPAYDVTYEGLWIADTEYLLKWGLSENMIKPEDNLQEVLFPYVIYMHNNTTMGNTPLIETMIPVIKLMQLNYLQRQKILAATAPDGYKVDVSQMSDITLGVGLEKLTPHDLYRIYKQTGIQYYKGTEDDGEGPQRKPAIEPTNSPYTPKLEQLWNDFDKNFDLLMRITGDNAAAAGQITNQAIGKSVLQSSRQISESASNYIWGSYLNTKQRIAKIVQLRLWDILVYGKKFGVFYYDGYRRALGENKVEYLRLGATDDMAKTAFDIMILAVIDDKQQQQLDNDINQALAQKIIEFHDAVDIRRIAQTDLKYSSYLMASRIKRRKKEAQEAARQNSEAEMRSNQAAAQTKSQGDTQLEMVKHQNKMAEQKQQQDDSIAMEHEKFFGILKADISKAILSKEGSSMKDIPTWVFEGLPMDKMLDHATVMAYMQTLGQQQEQQEQQPQLQPGNNTPQSQQQQ